MRRLLFCLGLLGLLGLLHAPGRASADEAQHLEGAHYALEAQTDAQDAQEMLRVLEAAWDEFERLLGGAPKLKAPERLRVRFFADSEGWANALREAGAAVPTGAGGYYWPPTQTAYLFRQPTRYYTRVLLVHEAAHQFHFLLRTRNKEPGAGWYTEGLAEYLSWHRWDGQQLELGRVPDLSLKDYAGIVRERMAAADFDFEAVAEGRLAADRAMAWALFSYVATGKEGKPLKGFDTFCRKLDLGSPVSSAFASALGSPRKHAAAFSAWVRAHPEPWAQIFNEWEGIGAGRLQGTAPVVSACRWTAPARALSASLEIPAEGSWKAGLLLHHTAAQDYTVALMDRGGAWYVDQRQGSTWKRLGGGTLASPPEGGEISLSAERGPDGVTLRMGAQVVGVFELPGDTLGLALDNCTARFAHVVATPR